MKKKLDCVLAEKIRKALDERGLKHMWVAKQLGMSRANFYAILCGHQKLSHKYFLKVIEYCGEDVTLADVMQNYLSHLFNYKGWKVEVKKSQDSAYECVVSLKKIK